MDGTTYKFLKDDLTDGLKYLDYKNYVRDSILDHLENQCSEMEVKLVKDSVIELDINKYSTIEDFIDDYQPILDLVDFPLQECFDMAKRKFKYSN